MVERFHEGARIQELSTEFGITRNTVSIVLARAGVRDGRPTRRTELIEPGLKEAISRYRAGETLEELSVSMDASRPVLRELLLREGVVIRARGKRR